MSLPVETIVQLTGYCLGIGGSIAVGNMLGKRDKESASKLFSVTFLVTLLMGLVFSVCAFPLSGPIARLLVPGGGALADYRRLYPCQHARCTGDRNWPYDGQLSGC